MLSDVLHVSIAVKKNHKIIISIMLPHSISPLCHTMGFDVTFKYKREQ